MSKATHRRTRAAGHAVVERCDPRYLLAAVAAAVADRFVDSIGINTHFSWSAPSPYSFANTIPSLGQSGIRHIRDNLKSPGFGRVQSLYDTFGVQTDIVVDDMNVSIASQVNALANPWATSIEGANEPDLNNRTYAGLADGTGAGGTNTYAATRRFQSDLFAAVNADARTAAKPVRSPAVGYSVRAGLLAGTDYDEATAHVYPPGTNPDYWRTDAAYLPATQTMNDGATKPLVVTETGYTTYTPGDFHVDDATQGKYLPRLLAEYFNRGIARTYLYEFADGGSDPANKEHNFGIINYDGTPKPAYTNIKNMIALLGEGVWNASTKQWSTPTFTPGALDFTLTGDTANVHQLLLQKSSGEFYLMLWNEALSYDGTAPISVPAKNVRVAINTPLAGASRFALGSTAAAETYVDPQTIDLSVPDSVVMLRLTPRATQAAVPLAVGNDFQSDTPNAAPAGWTPAAGDDWQIKTTGSPANQFLENRNVSGPRSISRPIGSTVTSSLVADFDYTWRWGGTASTGTGFRSQSVAFDLLNAANNGYRVKLYQGNNGDTSYDNKLTEIYKVTGGVVASTPLATGTGFNRPGWQSRGLTAPDWRHARVAWDAASGTITVYGDPDADGTLQTLARARDTSYTGFTTVALAAPDLTATIAPEFDNVRLSTPTVTLRATDRAAESPADAGTYTVTRTGSTASALTVAYSIGGTATNGTDYAALTGTVTIPAGSSTATIVVNPIADSTATAEADETVVLTLLERDAYHVGDGRSDDVVITNSAADLIVSDIAWDGTPVAGQPVNFFRVTVKNIGNAASPVGSINVHLYEDVNSIAFAGTTSANSSIPAGGSLIFIVVPPAGTTWTAGNKAITAWVDRNPNFWPNPTGSIAERSDLNNQTFKVMPVAAAAIVDTFDGTAGQPPAGWTTVGDGWTVKSEAGQSFLENITTGTGTRTISRPLPVTQTGSWSLDFKHTWRWGGSATGGYGFRSLSVSSDIVDAAGNGVRVRFYQGNANNAAYDNSLVEVYAMTAGVQAASPLATGGGFNRPGWKSVARTLPDWRAVRVTFDRGTRKLAVFADLTGYGVYQRLVTASLLGAPANFTNVALNAEGLANTVGPEFDDVCMALLP